MYIPAEGIRNMKKKVYNSMFAWREFCTLNKIKLQYQEALADTLVIPPNEFGCFRERAKKLIETPKSVILSGKAGRGKTHFLFAILRGILCERRASLCDIRFFPSVELDNKLIETFSLHKTVTPYIKSICDYGILAIDDFGAERDTTRLERDYFDLIERRTDDPRYITLYSTNLTFVEIYQKFGERIGSRLKRCEFINFNGPDLRETK